MHVVSARASHEYMNAVEHERGPLQQWMRKGWGEAILVGSGRVRVRRALRRRHPCGLPCPRSGTGHGL